MCNKIDFDSKSEAIKEIKRLRVDSRFRGKSNYNSSDKTKKLRPYKCNVCGLWHLTTLSINVTRTFRKGS